MRCWGCSGDGLWGLFNFLCVGEGVWFFVSEIEDMGRGNFNGFPRNIGSLGNNWMSVLDCGFSYRVRAHWGKGGNHKVERHSIDWTNIDKFKEHG